MNRSRVILLVEDNEHDVELMRKPVDFTRFTDAARQLGLYWLVLNQAPPRV